MFATKVVLALAFAALFGLALTENQAGTLNCYCYSQSSSMNAVSFDYTVPKTWSASKYYWGGVFTNLPSRSSGCSYSERYEIFGQLTRSSTTFSFPKSQSYGSSSSLKYFCALLESPYYISDPPSNSGCNVTISQMISCPALSSSYQSRSISAGAIVAIVLGFVFVFLFCLTIILCAIRRSKEREEERRRKNGEFNTQSDTSLVDLSDNAMRSNDGSMMTVPGVPQGSMPMMMTTPGMVQNGTAFSPYMTMPPAVYYMPNQDGSMTPVYMATNPVMTAQPQYYVQTNMPPQ